MKEAVKKSAGSSGIMTINKNIAADVEKLVQKYVSDAMQQGVDLDTLGPEQLKMIVQLNKPKTPQIFSADSPEGQDMTKKLMSFLDRQSGDNVVDLAGKKIDTSRGIMGGKSVKELMESGQVQKGSEGLKKGQKITDRDMFKNSNLNKTDAQIKARLEAGNKKSSANIKNNRQLTDEEIRDYELELGDSETWLNKGTFGEAEQALKNQKAYEAKMFAEYKSIGGSKRPGGPNASKRDPMPIRLMKNFEKELNEADLMAEGYSKDQSNVLIKARQKMISGEEMNPNESLLRVKEEFADNAGVDVEDFTDIDFEIDIPDYAKGGRAGFYTGGITDVEPSLDDIGHGTDALNARTRLMSPGNQATTSTGLNYLLAEDNDNMRIPFASGGSNPLMTMQNQQALNDLFAPFQKAPQTDYSNMMNKQSVYTPFNSGRIKDEFDEKTQTAFDEGAQISTQEFKNEPFDFTKDEFGKQGYSSDIRHGLGSSAFKDAVIDYMTSNLGVNANTNLFKGITPENFGSFAANAGSLFTEVPDMFSQAQAVAKSKGPYEEV